MIATNQIPTAQSVDDILHQAILEGIEMGIFGGVRVTIIIDDYRNGVKKIGFDPTPGANVWDAIIHVAEIQKKLEAGELKLDPFSLNDSRRPKSDLDPTKQ